MNYMDTIKLKSAEELLENTYTIDDYLNHIFDEELLIKAIKNAQRNAIEYALKVASENADADYIEHSNGIDEQYIEVYVINSSITGLKDKIFEDNNL